MHNVALSSKKLQSSELNSLNYYAIQDVLNVVLSINISGISNPSRAKEDTTTKDTVEHCHFLLEVLQVERISFRRVQINYIVGNSSSRMVDLLHNVNFVVCKHSSDLGKQSWSVLVHHSESNTSSLLHWQGSIRKVYRVANGSSLKELSDSLCCHGSLKTMMEF